MKKIKDKIIESIPHCQRYELNHLSIKDLILFKKNISEIENFYKNFKSRNVDFLKIKEFLAKNSADILIGDFYHSFKKTSIILFLLSIKKLEKFENAYLPLCKILPAKYFSYLDKRDYIFTDKEECLHEAVKAGDLDKTKAFLKRGVVLTGEKRLFSERTMIYLDKDRKVFTYLAESNVNNINFDNLYFDFYETGSLSETLIKKLRDKNLLKITKIQPEWEKLKDEDDILFDDCQWRGFQRQIKYNLVDINMLGRGGYHLLSRLISPKRLAWAISHGAKVNAREESGDSVLFSVLKRKNIFYILHKSSNISYAKALIKAGAKIFSNENIDMTDNEGRLISLRNIESYFIPLLIKHNLINFDKLIIGSQEIEKNSRIIKDKEKTAFEYLMTEPQFSLKNIRLIENRNSMWTPREIEQEIKNELLRFITKENIDELTADGINVSAIALDTNDTKFLKQLIDIGGSGFFINATNVPASLKRYKITENKVADLEDVSLELFQLLRDNSLITNKGQQYSISDIEQVDSKILIDCFKSGFFNDSNIIKSIDGKCNYRKSGLKNFILKDNNINAESHDGKNQLSYADNHNYAGFLLQNNITIKESLDCYHPDIQAVVNNYLKKRIKKEKDILNEISENALSMNKAHLIKNRL